MHNWQYIQALSRPPGRNQQSRGGTRPAREITSEARRIQRRRYRKY
ncbi:hypothetical protein V3G39_15660 [Dermatophilaceae bacterium Sec6.4]|nr:hypothetical protein [Actinomycetota bacterium]